jgi:hypothetical protein
MAAEAQNASFHIEAKAGVDFFLKLDFSDASGTPLDFAGWTFVSKVRQYGSEEVVFSPTLTLANPGAGQMAFRIPASTTYGMKNFNGYYDLLGTRPDGVVVELMQGDFTLVRSASRP